MVIRPTKSLDHSFRSRFIGVAGSLLLLLGTGLFPSVYFAEPGSRPQTSGGFQLVGPGVEHLKLLRGFRSDNQSTGPWVINLLRVDSRYVDIQIAHAMDEGVGLETTSSIAARAGAIAAVNAGFFRTTGTYRGEPAGVLVIDRKLLSEPIEGRAAFGLIGKRPTQIIFGHLKFSGYVESRRGVRRAISGLNRPRGPDELILYTPEFHRTTLTDRSGVEAVVRQNRIAQIRDQAGSTVIRSNGAVISAAGNAREWLIANLRLGSRVRIQTKLAPVESEMSALWERARSIVGGGPQLIRGGAQAITTRAEGIAPRFESDRHPRTAIARLKDGKILLATVDGRQPGVSAGMPLGELATLLLEFQAVDAINLDGGGSTTMVINGKVVNTPSDQTGERPVSDAILILPEQDQRRPLHSNRRMD